MGILTNLIESDFDQMEFNPLRKIGTPFALVYPRLAGQPRVTTFPDLNISGISGMPTGRLSKDGWDTLLRFCCLFAVSHGNPLGEYRDFRERRNICYELLSIKKQDVIRTIIETDMRIYRELVTFWLRISCNDVYEMWFTLRTNFHNSNAFLRSPAEAMEESAGPKMEAVRKGLDTTLKRIQELESVLFPDETIKRIAAQEETSLLYAETYATDWK